MDVSSVDAAFMELAGDQAITPQEPTRQPAEDPISAPQSKPTKTAKREKRKAKRRTSSTERKPTDKEANGNAATQPDPAPAKSSEAVAERGNQHAKGGKGVAAESQQTKPPQERVKPQPEKQELAKQETQQSDPAESKAQADEGKAPPNEKIASETASESETATAVEERERREASDFVRLASANELTSASPTAPETLPEFEEPAAPPVAAPKEPLDDRDREIALYEAPPVQSGDAVEYGVEHEPDRLSSCYLFGAAMLLSALFGIAPSLYRGVIYLLSENPPRMETWAFLLGAVGAIQAAYAIYLLQAPDWSTAKVAAFAMVALATLYAAALGAIVFSTPTGGVVRFLQIFSYHSDYRAAGWCFIMLLITSMIAFFGGKFAFSWQQEDSEMELLG